MSKLLTLVDAEIDALAHARALIVAAGKRKPGRPSTPDANPKKIWKLSPETRARMSAASKARWAAKKKAAK